MYLKQVHYLLLNYEMYVIKTITLFIIVKVIFYILSLFYLCYF
jgi:hypothetical protein